MVSVALELRPKARIIVLALSRCPPQLEDMALSCELWVE